MVYVEGVQELHEVGLVAAARELAGQSREVGPLLAERQVHLLEIIHAGAVVPVLGLYSVVELQDHLEYVAQAGAHGLVAGAQHASERCNFVFLIKIIFFLDVYNKLLKLKLH